MLMSQASLPLLLEEGVVVDLCLKNHYNCRTQISLWLKVLDPKISN
jgi:hypothetical protein